MWPVTQRIDMHAGMLARWHASSLGFRSWPARAQIAGHHGVCHLSRHAGIVDLDRCVGRAEAEMRGKKGDFGFLSIGIDRAKSAP